jgi:hypothetical protein
MSHRNVCLEALFRVIGDSEISNSKHQIPNTSQIPVSNDPNMFGILNFDTFEKKVCKSRFWSFPDLIGESSTFKHFWTPAFAGVTALMTF